MLGKIAVLALLGHASAATVQSEVAAVQAEEPPMTLAELQEQSDALELAEAEANAEVDADADFSAEAASAAVAAAELGYNIAKDIGNLIWEVTGSYKPYRHMWNFDLNGHGHAAKWLQDGDYIKIERKGNSCHSCANRRVKICLGTPGWMTWWKSVTIHANNRFMYELVANQDRRSWDCAVIEYAELLQNYIVLSKAKGWGVHTNMYWIQNSYAFRPGHDWHIRWERD